MDKLMDRASKEDGEDNLLEKMTVKLTNLRISITNSNIYQNQKWVLRILTSLFISIVIYLIMVLFFRETRLISLLIPFSKYPGFTIYSLIFTVIIPLVFLFILILSVMILIITFLNMKD